MSDSRSAWSAPTERLKDRRLRRQEKLFGCRICAQTFVLGTWIGKQSEREP